MSLSKRHYSDSSIRSNLHVIDTPPSPAEVSLTRKQLALEIKLQQSSHDLLLLYQESQNWVAVSEVAQTLNTISKRIEQLKNQLLSLENGSVVSHPPLLESIREAESPVNLNNHSVDQQRAGSPVESVTNKEGQKEDNTGEAISEGAIKEEDKGLEQSESSCFDREEVKGEGVNIIISLNHTDPEGTSKQPLDHNDKECPLKLEEHTEHNTFTNKPVSEESPEQPHAEELPVPIWPVSDEQLNQLLVQDLQDQSAAEQPVVDDPLDTLEQPPSLEISSTPTTTDESFEPLITKEEFEEPVTDTQVDQSHTEETEFQEPIHTVALVPDEQLDRSVTVTPVQPVIVDSFDQSELPVIGDASFEESLEKLAAFVDHIQIDLDIAEESLGDVQPDSNEEINPLEQNTEEEQQPISLEQDVLDSAVTPFSCKSRESSLEFEDAINDERDSAEISDDNSDNFFSPPESLEPLVSEDIHTHSDRPLEVSDPLEIDNIQDQPQLESATVELAKKEEDPVICSTNQAPQDTVATESLTHSTSSQTKEEEDPGNQVPDDLSTTDNTEASAVQTEEEVPIIISTQITAATAQDKQEEDFGSQVPDDVRTIENTVATDTASVPVLTDEEVPVIVSNKVTTATSQDTEEEISSNQIPDDLFTTENTVATVTASVPVLTVEEVPIIVSNKVTAAASQDTEEEISGNQIPDDLFTTENTEASVTTSENSPTISVPFATEEEVPSNQESSDSGDIELASTTTPVLTTPQSTEEDTPVIISNQVSYQSDEPPATSVHSPVASPLSKKEETPEIISANTEKEDTAPKHKMSEIAFTVKNFTNPSDNAMFYRVDILSYDVLFADPELLQHLPVLHSLENFLKLRKRLESIAKERETEAEIPNLIPQCNHMDTSIKNGNGVNEECEQFEKFLNQVVNDPKLGKEQVLVQFLSGREPSLSPPPTQESVPESPEVLVNGETDSSEPMDSQPDKVVSSSTSGEPILNDTSTFPPTSNDGEIPSIKKPECGGTRSPPQSDRDELTFSPNHSERTSSTTTNSSNIATDESAPELGEVNSKIEKVKLSRSESNPILGDYDMSLESGDTLHQSLVPSQFKYASSGNILEASVADIGDDGSKSRYVAKRSTMRDRLRKQGKRIVRSVSTKSKKRSTTLRVPPADMGNDVTIRRPITSQEWDPTCLLEELYSDYKQGTTMTDVSGESARHFGYLEKLPTGQSKASVLKGWKRRYFRAQEGNIYYYDDRTQEKALGFVRLSTARIILIPEKNQIQIVEKGSKNSIMLRAPDSQDLLAWHRALELEAVHPTPPAPQSPLFRIENPVLIVDIGACSVRAGLSRENAYPEVFFPAVCSLDARSFEVLDCGYNALLPQNRYGAHQIYPRKTSLRMDKHDTNLKIKAVDGILTTILERLDVDPQSTQVLLTHPPTVPEQDRNELAELLLEAFMFDGVCFQEQAVLALYSYNTTSGIMVDIGDHIDVVPFIDGYKIEAGVSRMLFGGNAVTEYLSKLITAKGIRYFSETEVYINRFIMENLCYISQNYDEDASECDTNPAEFTRAVDVDRFHLPDHRKVIALDTALFKAPEGLFRPNLWGKDVPSLPELVWKAIEACPIDQRREMAKKIYLSGSTTLLPGLQERLQKEVAALTPGGLTIEVHAAPTRHHAAYLGASVLAGLSSFQSYLVTQEEWNLEGIDALRKWGGT